MKRGASTKEHYRLLARLMKSDGCTSSPDFWFHDACYEHDVHYRTHRRITGEPLTREEADAEFLRDLQEQAITPIGRYVIAPAYYAAVRQFGQRYWDGREPPPGG